MPPRLIGLSGKKQSGKSSITNHLVGTDLYVEVSWAQPLKEIIGEKLLGLSDKQLYGTSTDKETVDPFWGKSPRELLQVIGTDCFRVKVHPDFWVKIGSRDIKNLLESGHNVVVSDCRFPNEADAIRSLGGIVVRVVREGQEAQVDLHPSEIALDKYDFDYIVTAKSGDLDGLFEKVYTILEAYDKTWKVL